MTASATERVRAYYDRSAGSYDASIRLAERLLFGDGRVWVCSQASGDVLEIGIGTGRKLPYYPAEARLVGIDLSPAMLAMARRRAAQLGVAVDLREGNAESLPFDNASFDTVVCTLVLCSVPDDRRAVTEVARVLRPGGRLLLLEHVRSPHWAVRIGQEALEPLVLKLEHDHLLRDPLDSLEAAGFAIETCRRSAWGMTERLVARRRSDASRLVRR